MYWKRVKDVGFNSIIVFKLVKRIFRKYKLFVFACRYNPGVDNVVKQTATKILVQLLFLLFNLWTIQWPLLILTVIKREWSNHVALVGKAFSDMLRCLFGIKMGFCLDKKFAYVLCYFTRWVTQRFRCLQHVFSPFISAISISQHFLQVSRAINVQRR